MKTKTATDLEQSKELAKILPVESADMRYLPSISEVPFIWSVKQMQESEAIPAWSLPALFMAMAEQGIWLTLRTTPLPFGEYVISCDFDDLWMQCKGNSPIDVTVEMIVKLNAHKLL